MAPNIEILKRNLKILEERIRILEATLECLEFFIGEFSKKVSEINKARHELLTLYRLEEEAKPKKAEWRSTKNPQIFYTEVDGSVEAQEIVEKLDFKGQFNDKEGGVYYWISDDGRRLFKKVRRDMVNQQTSSLEVKKSEIEENVNPYSF